MFGFEIIVTIIAEELRKSMDDVIVRVRDADNDWNGDFENEGKDDMTDKEGYELKRIVPNGVIEAIDPRDYVYLDTLSHTGFWKINKIDPKTIDWKPHGKVEAIPAVPAVPDNEYRYYPRVIISPMLGEAVPGPGYWEDKPNGKSPLRHVIREHVETLTEQGYMSMDNLETEKPIESLNSMEKADIFVKRLPELDKAYLYKVLNLNGMNLNHSDSVIRRSKDKK